ncbi:hypothetical protein M8J76_014431 [Diaphorina citri]|nr:hypothetical protein M8J76_014431 [Diaphorina citri]
MTEEKIITAVEWANEKLRRAQSAINENPWDIEAWGILIREAQTRWINEVRPFFEQLVTTYPTTGRYWKIYIEQEMRSRNFERVEKLFQRCLIKVLNIDLWKLYLAYVKETKASLVTFKEKMAQAYDFALDKIGMDLHSFPIWNDYINFLKGVEAVGSYAENQKITAVRKVCQRGVVNPMQNIELLWKDYIAYEQSINPIIAEKIILERSREYMNARRVAKEFEVNTRGLNKNLPCIPPTGHAEEIKQVELWKKYIGWEKSNPLRCEETSVITRRVMFAFEQALLCMGHHPDIWFEAAQFLEQSARTLLEKGDVNAAKLFSDEVSAVYERATNTILKNSQILHFAYADFEESRRNYERVHAIYLGFLDNQEINPTLTYIQYMKFARRAEGIKSARNVFKRAREDEKSSYQVYISAALMEYYCSKDKNIAFRIFELGLKKFSHIPEYVMNYIDYLSHLNEDNNTRSNIGDLASIVKVEKRRSAVLTKMAEFEGKDTAQLVDRYKFLDLYPCSPAELKSIGYTEVTKSAMKAGTTAGTTGSTALFSSQAGLDGLDEERKGKTLVRPDLTQMIPYKPKPNAWRGEHLLPGGGFPAPPAVAQLLSILPPPGCFHGPFVGVDPLLDLILALKLPSQAPRPVPSDDPALQAENAKLFDLAASVTWSEQTDLGGAGGGGGMKRKKKMGDESEEEEEGLQVPANDLYRLRQKKRVR